MSVRGTNARFDNPTIEVTVAYLHRHRKQLLCEEPPQFYFGGWENTTHNVFEYDLSLILPEMDEAVAFAVAQHQSEVYDFAGRRSISVSGHGCREAM